MRTTSIMIVGVGGQGTLLASRVLGSVLTAEGYDVKLSEVHGMSQRGGSVVTYVRYGSAVYSPVVEKGEADVILAFEQLEACRSLPWLKKGGRMIVNTQQIMPMPVVTGAMTYPEAIIEKLQAAADVTALDALALARESGNAKAVNVVLLGVLAKGSGIGKEKWIDALKATVPPKFLEINLKAFELGYQQ